MCNLLDFIADILSQVHKTGVYVKAFTHQNTKLQTKVDKLVDKKVEHFCPPNYTIRHFVMYITNVQLHVFQHIS